MAIPRFIPILLIRDNVLVKGKRFAKHRYIGDPINAIRIFNECQVDELIVVDISAGTRGRCIDQELISTFCGECFMPLAVGGGIRDIEQARSLLRVGAEKVIVNTGFLEEPEIVRRLSDEFGTQSIVVSIDYRPGMFGKRLQTYAKCGSEKHSLGPVEAALKAEELGAGEIMLTAINREGAYDGYDLDTLKTVCDKVRIPVIINGGAGSVAHLGAAVANGASAAAAGSMFVFHGAREAVLISYPDREKLDALVG